MFGNTPEEYDQKMKAILTDEAYAIWHHNMNNEDKIPQVKDYLRNKPSSVKITVSDAIAQAREAVSGYAENNGARKAVEALADAIENSRL